MTYLFSVAIGSQILALMTHFYLSIHYYPLQLGMSTGQSLCNINAKFDCDSVALSSYSSFLGIPLSVWGFAMNAVMLVVLLLGRWRISSHPQRSMRTAWAFSAATLLASVVMGLIAVTQLDSYCLFCMATYGLSLITFGSLSMALGRAEVKQVVGDMKEMILTPQRLIPWLIVPAAAWLMHSGFMQQYSSSDFDRRVGQVIADWAASPQVEFNSSPALIKGSSNPKLILVEFADFRCGHCQQAAHPLATFVKAHPDVQLRFYNFPLDGQCNKVIQFKDGISCRLAAAVTCAGQLNSDAGWKTHDVIFAHQRDYQGMGTTAAVDEKLKAATSPWITNWDSFQSCMDSPETLSALQAQAEDGEKAGVKGTPTVYANGRRLSMGQLPKVLNAARQAVLGK